MTVSIAERHELTPRRNGDPHGTSRIARLVGINESLAIANHSLAERRRRPWFVCECGSVDCRGIVRLPLDEYERIRRNGGLLRLVGHVCP
jgi:hypothetical protein